jgi:DNA-binding MarR family transcriptional regulator
MANLDPFTKPGHLIRRLQQIAVSLFEREMSESGLTPTQYLSLQVLSENPGLDQVTLSAFTSVDRSMTARNVDILVERKLIRKLPAKKDRRANSLFINKQALDLLKRYEPKADRSQENILAALLPGERAEFMRLVKKIISGYGNIPALVYAGRRAGKKAEIGRNGAPTRKTVRADA